MMGVPAGLLDRRVTLQSKSVTRNSIGEEVVTWADFATVWGYLKPVRGAERFAADQVQQTADLRCYIRDLDGVTPDMRIVWDGDPYDITAVIPGTGAWRGTLELMTVHGVRNGR